MENQEQKEIETVYYKMEKAAKEIGCTTTALRFYITKDWPKLDKYIKRSNNNHRLLTKSQLNFIKEYHFLIKIKGKKRSFAIEELKEKFNRYDAI